MRDATLPEVKEQVLRKNIEINQRESALLETIRAPLEPLGDEDNPQVAPLSLKLPGGYHDSVRMVADAHAKMILATREFRADARRKNNYPDNFEEFIEQVLGMQLTDNQREIVQSVQLYQRIAVRSCHGSGKTRVLAAITIAWLHLIPFSKVVTTGPGGTQLKEGLWQDIRYLAAHAKQPLLSTPLTTKWEIAPGWFALGYKPAEHRAINFQGIHAPSMLLIIDEAAEVEGEIYGALNSLLTGSDCHLVMLGNPTKIDNAFERAFKPEAADRWHTITIRASDTPNIIAGKEVVPGLVTREWVANAIAENGEDSDYVRSRVYAEFPRSNADGYIPGEWLDKIDALTLDPIDGDRWEAGVDVARFGGDNNCVVIRCGPKPMHQESWQGMNLMESVGKIRSILADYPTMSAIKVDINGIGSGIADRLRELEYPVVDVMVSEKSSDTTQWPNLRNELWWQFRELIRSEAISGPLNGVVRDQLVKLRAKYDSSHNRPIVESKDAMKGRGVNSPDEAEAMMLAFTNKVEPYKKPAKSVPPVGLAMTSSWEPI